jgi:L-2-hydroxyglutarate oxidase LhgO
METSSRNSEVIHAGIYYPTGSLKARLCVAGKQQLCDYCRDRGLPHCCCGKTIVATVPGQISVLEEYERQATLNGMTLSWLDRNAVHELEPEVEAVAGLLSESTGIIYPITEPGGLGVHLTMSMGGQIKFGPNVSWAGD